MNVAILAIAVIALAGIPSAFACTPQDTIAWNSILFSVIPNSGIMHNSEPTLNDGLIALPYTYQEVQSFNSVNQKIADELNNRGYFVDDGSIRQVSANDVDNNVAPGFGEFFSTTCVNGLSQMIGGMLLQPDAMTLALAYGIVNAVWMAPLAIGIGAGVYLTKSKLKKKNE